MTNAGVRELAKRLVAFHLHRRAKIRKAFGESIACAGQNTPISLLQVDVVEAPVIAVHVPRFIIVFLDTNSNSKPETRNLGSLQRTIMDTGTGFSTSTWNNCIFCLLLLSLLLLLLLLVLYVLPLLPLPPPLPPLLVLLLLQMLPLLLLLSLLLLLLLDLLLLAGAAATVSAAAAAAAAPVLFVDLTTIAIIAIFYSY